MSLRDQLLKAGAVSPEKAKKAEKQVRQTGFQQKKGGKKGDQQEQQRRQQQAVNDKREKDKALNQEREQKRVLKDKKAVIRQILSSKALAAGKDANCAYNFTEAERYVRKVMVTDAQQKQLGRGQLGIVRNPGAGREFLVLPRESMEKLIAMEANCVVLLHPEGTADDEDDWWE